MQLNVWNDLAKAKRRWTEKKRFLPPGTTGKQVESPNRRMIFFVRFEKDNIELKHNLNENSQTGV